MNSNIHYSIHLIKTIMRLTDFHRMARTCIGGTLAAFACLCGGCDDAYVAEATPDKPLALVLQGSIEQECLTRADDGGFADGDRMGVFVVDYEGDVPGTLKGAGNRATNFALTCRAASGVWEGNAEIYWKDGVTPVDVYGYYPFESGLTEVAARPFSVAADQSLAPEGEMSAYEKSDFLWAKVAGAKPAGGIIRLNYKHRMAGVKVVLQKGTGFEGDEWEKLPRLVTVNNTCPDATINMATGIVTPADTEKRPIVMACQNNDTYRAVVVPQTVAAGKPVVGITIDGVSYTLNREAEMAYTSGKLHSFTIQVNKRSGAGDYALSITSEEITAWENDELTHSFSLSAYVTVHVEKEGTLEACLAERGTDLKELKNLKVTGKLTEVDFQLIREKMPYLAALNLREASMVHANTKNPYDFDAPDVFEDNMLPQGALYGNKSALRTLILPDNLVRIGSNALRELQLAKQLVIPNSVKRIDGEAFASSPEVNLEVVLPDSLEYIGDNAFSNTNFSLELKLPNTLRHIGDYAFSGAHNVYGTFRLPDKLEYLGEAAFYQMGNDKRDLKGEIVIPQFLTEIPTRAFGEIGFANGTALTLHDGVTTIGEESFASLEFYAPISFPASLRMVGVNAFTFCRMQGTLNLPENLVVMGTGAFGGDEEWDFSDGLVGELTIPKKISILSAGVFAGQNFTAVTIPETVTMIKPYAFRNLEFLKTVSIAKNVDYIGELAFSNCPNVQTVVCLNPTPPTVFDNTFEGMYFDKVILEVPEASVELYRRTPIWNRFLNVTPHKELAFNIPEINCLHAGVTRTGVVRSEGEWEVTECPDWCTISLRSGGANRREEVTVTVSPMAQGSGNREGRIVFRLKGTDYTTYTAVAQYDYEHAEDKEIVLQEATAGGREIPLFIVGDGFSAASIADGTYLEQMKQQMEHFFDIEPYRSYRNYFTVFTSVAVSPESGIQMAGTLIQSNKFNTRLDQFGFHADIELVKNYAQRVSSRAADFGRLTVLVLANHSAFLSTTVRDWSGCNITLCCRSNASYPYDQRGLVQHELGGANFGDLGTEAVSHFDFIRGCTCPGCNALGAFNEAKSRGGFANLSLTGSVNTVPWKHLIFDPRYSDMVDVYEGGYNHQRGVFRSEIKSCMGTYIPYYNTISREAIVRRILSLAGEEFSFEKFVEKDSREGKPEN